MLNIISGVFYLMFFSYILFLGKAKNDKWLVIFSIVMLSSIFGWHWFSGYFGVKYYVYPKTARWVLMLCFMVFWYITARVLKRTIGFTPVSIISFFIANSGIYLLMMYILTILGFIYIT